MKITKITDRTVLFTVPESAESYVNLCLIRGDKHNFIIDTGVGESSVNAVLEYLGNDKKPIVAVITHAHWDHIFGNSALEGSLIISHSLCRDIIDKDWDTGIKDVIQEASRGYMDAEVHKCLPNLVFDSSLHFLDDGITLFHTPAHTNDGISIYDAVDKTLHTGDNFGVFDGVAYLWGEYLDISEENPSLCDKSVSDFECMIEAYKQYDFDICISSHSEPQTREVLTLLESALEKARP